MQKIYTVLLAILLVSTTATFASNNIDSIGIENNKGKTVIIYKVEAKETYYSISKKYNVSYKDVMEFNDNQFLQIGVTLKIPTQKPFLVANIKQSESNSSAYPVYVIKAKDNLNMLAEKYGTTVNEIKRVNNLSSNSLQIGQELKIPSSAEIIEETTTNTVTNYASPQRIVTLGNESSITHTIKAKENLNLIAKMYGTTVEDIKILNGLSSNNLKIGQILKISSNTRLTEAPLELKTVTTENNVEKPIEKLETQKPIVKTESIANEGSIEHVVAASETIYAIAKKYNTTTYQIQTSNNLKSSNLKVGQKLMIKSLAPVSIAVSQDNGTNEPIESMITPNLKGAASKYGISQIEEKGVAVWIEDPDLDPAKMLILHRTAPIGTVIKITNPMTSRSTFAKVIGKYTENETTKDVIIVMTKAVADAIGALDKRFACTLSYGAIENEQ